MTDSIVIGFFVVLAFFFGLHLLFTARATSASRKLSDLLYQHDPEKWIALGRPRGGAMTLPHLSFWKSDITGTRSFFRYLDSTPEWAYEIPDACEAIRTLRRNFRFMEINFSLFVGFLVFSSLAFYAWSNP